jgi:hypothetical protein
MIEAGETARQERTFLVALEREHLGVTIPENGHDHVLGPSVRSPGLLRANSTDKDDVASRCADRFSIARLISGHFRVC